MTARQEKHLMKQVEKDDIYQEMLMIRDIYEQEYTRILRLLSPQDQYYLKMYIRACEGVGERIMRTAYFLIPKA